MSTTTNGAGNGALADPVDVAAAAQATPDAVAQEGGDGASFLACIQAQADAIKGAEYAGRLNSHMVDQLAALLSRTPTPPRYIKRIPPVDGKPYESTGLNSSQIQVDMMNAGYGRSHWRELRWYPPDKRGYLCKVFIIVGNDVAKASLDEHGALVAGDAEILAESCEWGAVKRGNTDGDAYKGSATNAKKRAISPHGPGADVYRLEFEDENVGGVGNLQAPASEQPPDASTATASDGQRRMLRAKAREGGVDDATLANIILWAANQPQLAFQSLAHATLYVEQLLTALPASLVTTIKGAIDHQGQLNRQHAAAQAAAAQLAAIQLGPAPPATAAVTAPVAAAAAPAAPPTARQPIRRDVQVIGGSDIPNDLPTEADGTSALAPVALTGPEQAQAA